MKNKKDFIYRVQYENLISAIDTFCNNDLKRGKRYNRNDIIISLNKILKLSYNTTIHLISIIDEEDKKIMRRKNNE